MRHRTRARPRSCNLFEQFRRLRSGLCEIQRCAALYNVPLAIESMIRLRCASGATRRQRAASVMKCRACRVREEPDVLSRLWKYWWSEMNSTLRSIDHTSFPKRHTGHLRYDERCARSSPAKSLMTWRPERGARVFLRVLVEDLPGPSISLPSTRTDVVRCGYHADSQGRELVPRVMCSTRRAGAPHGPGRPRFTAIIGSMPAFLHQVMNSLVPNWLVSVENKRDRAGRTQLLGSHASRQL